MSGVHDQVTKIIGATSTAASVDARGTKGALAVELLDAAGNQLTSLGGSSLVNEAYDYISLGNFTANNDPQTIIFKSGGAGGTTVATLTLAYDGSNRLTSVTRT